MIDITVTLSNIEDGNVDDIVSSCENFNEDVKITITKP